MTTACGAGPLVLLSVLFAGCAVSRAAAPRAEPARPTETSALARSDTSRLRLKALLEQVRPAGPVALALDETCKSALTAALSSLGEQQRAELAKPDSRSSLTRPLLHVLLGGESVQALVALAATDAAAKELLASAAGQSRELGELAPVASEIARRAAAHFLRRAAPALSLDSERSTEIYDVIDAAARTLERNDIRLAAQEAAVQIDGSARRWLVLSALAARELKLEAADQALTAAGKLDTKRELDTSLLRRRQLLTQLEQALDRRPSERDLNTSVALGRALIELDLPQQAARLLEPHRALAPSHLALATTLAVAMLDKNLCPGVPALVRHQVLCAAVWQRDKNVERALSLLDSAWKSGGGRDERALETYVGLAQVIPWQYVSALGAGSTELARDFEARLLSLEATIAELARVSLEYQALSLFVETLRAGFDAVSARSAGAAIEISAAVQKRLVDRARAMASHSRQHSSAATALLGVAALLAVEQDVLPLLDLAPQKLEPKAARARAVLRQWAAVTRRRPAVAEQALSELALLMPSEDAGTLERARLILFMAESDAALTEGARAYDVLLRIGKQLSSKGGPGELRLQAAIDAAGALRRSGAAGAVELLDKTIHDIESAGDVDVGNKLLILAKAYALLLRALSAEGAERLALRQKIADLFGPAAKSDMPASIRVWSDLWQAELSRLALEDACKSDIPCRIRTSKARFPAYSEISARLRPEPALLLPTALWAGAVSLSLDYSVDTGLVPAVSVEPRLLALEFPKGTPVSPARR